MAEACRGGRAWKHKFSNSVNLKKNKILIHFFNKTAFQIPEKFPTQMMALQRQYFVHLYPYLSLRGTRTHTGEQRRLCNGVSLRVSAGMPCVKFDLVSPPRKVLAKQNDA